MGDATSRRIYVASSWRNHLQIAVVHVLRQAGHEVYDFKNPEGGTGFHWSETMPTYQSGDDSCSADDYLVALEHPRSIEGFNSDYNAMEWADTCVLVLPCGRSAHLEAGWFARDDDKELVILLDGPTVTPELMYRMADVIVPTFDDLLGWAGIEGERGYNGWHAAFPTPNFVQ